MEIPPGHLALGVPARVVPPIEPMEDALRYQALAERYKKGLSPLEPPRRYRLTLRGQDALNPFSELHLGREGKEVLEALRQVAQGFPLAPREAKPLLEESWCPIELWATASELSP